MLNVNEIWDKAWTECVGDKDLTGARVAGRATKATPNKEDITQWQVQGPEWVNGYIKWRQGNPDWKIWKTPSGFPAVELGLMPIIAGVPVKMVIDRVFQRPDGSLVIVDLKTSQRVPENPLQLGFYKVGMEHFFDMEINQGAYYMARSNSMSEIKDLSWYTSEKIEFLVGQFDTARKAGIFLPNADSCGLCWFTKDCQFTSKS